MIKKEVQKEIIIKRGFNPFQYEVGTGFTTNDLKDSISKDIINDGFLISFGNQNEWIKLTNH